MREPVYRLSESNITSEHFVIAPTQIEYISQIFADSVADAMNMRAFAQKFAKLRNSRCAQPYLRPATKANIV